MPIYQALASWFTSPINQWRTLDTRVGRNAPNGGYFEAGIGSIKPADPVFQVVNYNQNCGPPLISQGYCSLWDHQHYDCGLNGGADPTPAGYRLRFDINNIALSGWEWASNNWCQVLVKKRGEENLTETIHKRDAMLPGSTVTSTVVTSVTSTVGTSVTSTKAATAATTVATSTVQAPILVTPFPRPDNLQGGGNSMWPDRYPPEYKIIWAVIDLIRCKAPIPPVTYLCTEWQYNNGGCAATDKSRYVVLSDWLAPSVTVQGVSFGPRTCIHADGDHDEWKTCYWTQPGEAGPNGPIYADTVLPITTTTNAFTMNTVFSPDTLTAAI